MDSKTLFTKISPVRLFFIVSVPGAISMLASALYQVIDGILVGQILGELAFAALNLAMPFVIINFSLADLIGGVLYLLAVPLLRLMGAEGELLHLSVQYLQVYAICAPVTTIIFAVDNYLRICGKIKSSMFLNIFMYAEGFVQPLLYGMCDSLQPAVSYNLGAGNKKRIQAIEKCCYTASGVVSLLSAAVLFFFPDVITRMFVSSPDAVFLEMARGGAVMLFALTYLTRWFSFATQSYMVAVERAGAAALISVSTALIFPVLLVAALWPLGLTGIWLNFAGTSVLAGIMSAVILKKNSEKLEKFD
ncbi:MAG: MATE family efflux transporter [Blautia hansenii]